MSNLIPKRSATTTAIRMTLALLLLNVVLLSHQTQAADAGLAKIRDAARPHHDDTDIPRDRLRREVRAAPAAAAAGKRPKPAASKNKPNSKIKPASKNKPASNNKPASKKKRCMMKCRDNKRLGKTQCVKMCLGWRKKEKLCKRKCKKVVDGTTRRICVKGCTRPRSKTSKPKPTKPVKKPTKPPQKKPTGPPTASPTDLCVVQKDITAGTFWNNELRGNGLGSGKLSNLPFTSTGFSDMILEVIDLSAKRDGGDTFDPPLSENEVLLQFDSSNDWTINFSCPVSSLLLYFEDWDDGNYTFSTTPEIVSSDNSVDNFFVGDTLVVTEEDWNGIFRFTGPLTTLSIKGLAGTPCCTAHMTLVEEAA